MCLKDCERSNVKLKKENDEHRIEDETPKFEDKSTYVYI